jgi:beta-lactamase superfamily II metal-dependent hydrolase
MHKLTFFPVGNADCCLIELANNGPKLLFDYAHRRVAEDPRDARIDLHAAIRNRLGPRGYVDVLAITHLDADHIDGISNLFWLDRHAAYQGPRRIKIKELWVPAAAVVEQGLVDEDRLIRSEARHRLLNNYGVRVFSRPNRLASFLAANNLTVADRKDLIIDAGNTVPTFAKLGDGVEFFIHAPFAAYADEPTIKRNEAAIVLQAVFRSGDRDTRVLLMDDATHESIAAIVRATLAHDRADRLAWDVIRVPHHCSYRSLGPIAGDPNEATDPVAEVQWLYEDRGPRHGGILVASCRPIRTLGLDKQPPHMSAAIYYQAIADDVVDGRFVLTMENGSIHQPLPVEVLIDHRGATLVQENPSAGAAATSVAAPRAGGE